MAKNLMIEKNSNISNQIFYIKNILLIMIENETKGEYLDTFIYSQFELLINKIEIAHNESFFILQI